MVLSFKLELARFLAWLKIQDGVLCGNIGSELWLQRYLQKNTDVRLNLHFQCISQIFPFMLLQSVYEWITRLESSSAKLSRVKLSLKLSLSYLKEVLRKS